MAKKYYKLRVAGCTRQLPILNVTDTLAIAGFVILGDTELTVNTAAELAGRIPSDAEIIMTAETKPPFSLSAFVKTMAKGTPFSPSHSVNSRSMAWGASRLSIRTNRQVICSRCSI